MAAAKAIKRSSKHIGDIVGGHVRLVEDIRKDIMFQCFLTNSHGHFSESRLEAWRGSGIRFSDDIRRIVHASYVTFPWSSKAETIEKSIRDIKIASECANIIGLWGLNIHLPKEYHLSEGFEDRVGECLKACQPPCKLLFEITGSSTRYVSEGRLPALPIGRMQACRIAIEKANRSIGKSWGFCFDTAHAFVQGQPLTTKEDIERLIRDANGLDIAAIHLNGSLFPFRSGRDQHAPTMAANDYIWGNDRSGIKRLVEWIVSNRIPTVLERPGLSRPDQYDEEIGRLEKLIDNDR